MFEWLFGKKKPKYDTHQRFNHLDALGHIEIKPFVPPPPRVPSDIDVLTSETRELEDKLLSTLDPSGKRRVRESEVQPLPLTEEQVEYGKRVVVSKIISDHRPSWPETWMSVARAIAQRSYDPRLQVGAIIVSEDNTRMLSVGYNGNYRGGPNEPESLEPGKSGMIHAEQNALVKCDFNFPKKKHMYLTHSPCRACAKLIINAEISRVVYNEVYRDPSGIELLKSAGVEVYSMEEAILKAKS